MSNRIAFIAILGSVVFVVTDSAEPDNSSENIDPGDDFTVLSGDLL